MTDLKIAGIVIIDPWNSPSADKVKGIKTLVPTMPRSKCPPTNIQTQAVGAYLEIMQNREIQLRLHSKTLSQIMGSVRWLGGLGSLQPNPKT